MVAPGLRFVTANLGINIGDIDRVLGRHVASVPVDVDCHWSVRIGLTMPVRNDVWWALSSDPRALGDDACAGPSERLVDALIEFGVPALMANFDRDELERIWSDTDDPGTGPVWALIYAAILASARGNSTSAASLLDRADEVADGWFDAEIAAVRATLDAG
jgi:hypothetical protein